MRVFIHGRGSISAAGSDPATAHASWLADHATWVIHEATSLPVYRAVQAAPHTELRAFTERRQSDRSTVLALHAADQAVAQAGWKGADFGILLGCSRGPTAAWEAAHDAFRATGRTPTKTSPRTTLGVSGFALADYFGTPSVATGMSVTCSSGFHALLHGIALLKANMLDRVLVGGTEAPLSTFTLRQMQALRIYADPPSPGQHACRPLANSASGMVVGEGAALIALSAEPSAFEIVGLGFGREGADSMTGITRDGEGLQRSMRMALEEAGEEPSDVILHAPGTRRGNAAERRALETVLTNSAAVTLRSAKHLTGHTFGASGPLGLDFALSLLEHRIARGAVMVNATGFGGNAVSVMIRRSS